MTVVHSASNAVEVVAWRLRLGAGFPAVTDVSICYPGFLIHLDRARLLANAMHGNTSVKRMALEVYCNEEVSGELAQMLRQNSTLVEFELRHGLLTAGLLEALLDHPRLSVINLSHGCIFGMSVVRAYLDYHIKTNDTPVVWHFYDRTVSSLLHDNLSALLALATACRRRARARSGAPFLPPELIQLVAEATLSLTRADTYTVNIPA
jgi:hypothetical protein